LAVLVLAYVGSISTLAALRWKDAHDVNGLLTRQAQVGKAENRVAAYRRIWTAWPMTCNGGRISSRR
jgi:hypothetical protein